VEGVAHPFPATFPTEDREIPPEQVAGYGIVTPDDVRIPKRFDGDCLHLRVANLLRDGRGSASRPDGLIEAVDPDEMLCQVRPERRQTRTVTEAFDDGLALLKMRVQTVDFPQLDREVGRLGALQDAVHL
jgi:hypothetical protein